MEGGREADREGGRREGSEELLTKEGDTYSKIVNLKSQTHFYFRFA